MRMTKQLIKEEQEYLYHRQVNLKKLDKLIMSKYKDITLELYKGYNNEFSKKEVFLEIASVITRHANNYKNKHKIENRKGELI